jgi:hypothetical protein
MTARRTWFVGERNQVHLEWPAGGTCGYEQWNCPPPPDAVLQVNSVSCEGCTITRDPSGGYSGGGAVIGAVATREGSVTVHANATYLPTDETADTSITIPVDREVALTARCELTSIALLANFMRALEAVDGPDPQAPGYVPFRDCRTGRRSTETVVVFPQITTQLGHTIFPFIPDDAIELDDEPDPNVRRLSALSISTPPDAWWYGGGFATADFAIFAHAEAGARVDLATRLSSGSVASTSVVIPPLCDATHCALDPGRVNAP